MASEAKEIGTGMPLVTVSDKAFALLLFANYFDKWKAPRSDRDANQNVATQKNETGARETSQTK